MRRFSIRAIMTIIVISAVGLAALRNANDWWSGTMLLLSLAATGTGVLGTLFLRGRDRGVVVGLRSVFRHVPGLDIRAGIQDGSEPPSRDFDSARICAFQGDRFSADKLPESELVARNCSESNKKESSDWRNPRQSIARSRGGPLHQYRRSEP